VALDLPDIVADRDLVIRPTEVLVVEVRLSRQEDQVDMVLVLPEYARESGRMAFQIDGRGRARRIGEGAFWDRERPGLTEQQQWPRYRIRFRRQASPTSHVRSPAARLFPSTFARSKKKPTEPSGK